MKGEIFLQMDTIPLFFNQYQSTLYEFQLNTETGMIIEFILKDDYANQKVAIRSAEPNEFYSRCQYSGSIATDRFS